MLLILFNIFLSFLILTFNLDAIMSYNWLWVNVSKIINKGYWFDVKMAVWSILNYCRYDNRFFMIYIWEWSKLNDFNKFIRLDRSV